MPIGLAVYLMNSECLKFEYLMIFNPLTKTKVLFINLKSGILILAKLSYKYWYYSLISKFAKKEYSVNIPKVHVT